jgi:hypothetical protein
MNNLKPYIGRYLDKPIYLNLGQFGWYLKYDEKLYGVPSCFQENFDLNKAIKIIDFKNKRKQEETINKELSECEIIKKLDGDKNIRQGKAKDFLNPNNKPVFKK